MSVKSFLFDVTVAGSFDGVTSFSMPIPLPTPNAGGQYVIPVTTAAGRIDPDSLSAIVGVGTYWIRSVAINNGNPAVIRALVGLTQPKPSISVGGNAIIHPIILQTTNPAVDAQPPVQRGPVVPPGWIITMFFDDAAGNPIVGPYQMLLELETLPAVADSARAIRSMEFPGQPVTVV